MIEIKIKTSVVNFKEIQYLANELNKIGASLCEETSLLLEVNQISINDNSQDIITVAAEDDITNES